MAPTYSERFIPRIKTKQLTCEGPASCTTLTTGAGTAAAPAINMGTATTGLFMDGAANIGLTIGGVLAKSIAAGQDITVRYGDIAKFKGVRANGTYASPTDTADTNILFDIVAMGYASSGYHDAAVIRFRQDGALSGINVPCRIMLMSRDSAGNLNNVIGARASGACEIYGALAHQGSTLGFYNTTPTTKPTVTGSRGSNAALADLLTKLAGLGLLTDSTTA